MCKSPVFVLGTPRSGTTLTAKILGKHSHLFMPGEMHFFSDIYSKKKQNDKNCIGKEKDDAIARILTLYGRYNEPEDQKRIDTLCSLQHLEQQLQQHVLNYKMLLDIFMEVQLRYAGKKRWGNNTPRDIFHVPEILSFYPDAKIIVCIRDVRDFLLSYKDKWKNTAPDHVDRLKKLYHPVITSILWKSSMKLIPEIMTRVPTNNYYILKYENLVSKPEQEIRTLCSIIEEDFEPTMLKVNFANSSTNVHKNGIFSSSIGRWKKNLAIEDAYIAQQITRKQLVKFGYPLVKLNPCLVKVATQWLATPIALLRGLDANKASRGPLLPYLFSRLKSLVS